MSTNIFYAVKNFFSNDITGKAAEYLGEDQNTVKKSLDLIIPSILAAIVNKSESGNINSLVTNANDSFESGMLHKLSDLFSANGGGVPAISPGLISSIFGDKFGGFANAVSGFTGLKGASSSSLISTVLGIALAVIGKFAKDTNATPGAIQRLLGEQKQTILSAIPAGFDISRFFGSEKLRAASASPPVIEKNSNKWLLPLLLGLVGLLFLLWWLRGCNKKEEVVTLAATDTMVVTKTDTVILKEERIKVTLPNGVVLNAYKGGIEDLLVIFLQDNSSKPGNDNWFDFNQLNFEFGTTRIIPESRSEIDNIKEILVAFPKTKIKIGGYTDKVGNKQANKKLSQDRANAVAEELKKLGVGNQVLGAEGYGSEFAKYPSSAPEKDRVKDRRVSVSVREK